MTGNTALSYQMMIEEKLMSAMIHSQQQGEYSFACAYANAHLNFLDVDPKLLPKLPIILKTESDKQNAFVTQYFNLLTLITKTTSSKITEVRKKYGNKGKTNLLQ